MLCVWSFQYDHLRIGIIDNISLFIFFGESFSRYFSNLFILHLALFVPIHLGCLHATLWPNNYLQMCFLETSI